MNFVPKKTSRAVIKRLLEEQRTRSEKRSEEMLKNYVCIINTDK